MMDGASWWVEMFLDSEAPLGQTWQQSACPVSAESLHGLVLDSTIPSIVKAQSTHGHFCTANQMNKVARRYWKPELELLVYLQQEPLRLNPLQPQPLLERLCTLHTDTAGGIILVTKQFSNDGSALDHIITIIAAPLLALLGTFLKADPPGMAIADYWDPAVLAPYALHIGDGLHCPLLAAKEGFS
jgi:hypothetical protein